MQRTTTPPEYILYPALLINSYVKISQQEGWAAAKVASLAAFGEKYFVIRPDRLVVVQEQRVSIRKMLKL